MFIRYPGSKAKLFDAIRATMPYSLTTPLWQEHWDAYCEPFFGSGAIGWQLFPLLYQRVRRVIANDRDPGMYALWLTVRDDPKMLCRLVAGFRPTVDEFYRFKELDGRTDDADVAVQGFRKLALHQMSVSGYGYMAGGPIGGRGQGSEYNVDCRWNPDRIRRKVAYCHKAMRQFERFDVECKDFSEVLGTLPAKSFAYIDPPYYVKGNMLYRYGMEHRDHERLATVLRSARFSWALSYDDCPEVRALYAWGRVREFDMVPCNQTCRRVNGEAQLRRKNREIVVCSGKW